MDWMHSVGQLGADISASMHLQEFVCKGQMVQVCIHMPLYTDRMEGLQVALIKSATTHSMSVSTTTVS